ncbi:MAG: hypothetical protein CMQ61_00945 [Gammaproteobacteria bacterium]|nr:hypothetical protein [Gammaproteobacteria bacterium]
MSAPQIWVDADACPVVIKNILFKAAERTGIGLTLVANQPLSVPRAANIRALQVASGYDVADNEIVRRVASGDLVITADIPLAAEVMAKGADALNPRGELYSPETIGARLNMRDFMDTMRASGVHTGGPSALGSQEKQAFANALDRWLRTTSKT